VQPPSDGPTSRKIGNAQARLEALVDTRCATDALLAGLDTCAGPEVAGARRRAKQGLRCANWRRAVAVICSAYGPS
jgi:hypothetical protein